MGKTYVWHRANEDVKFKGFSPSEMSSIMPALYQTDAHLKDAKKLDATFRKKNPTLGGNPKIAALTHYHVLGGGAHVDVNPSMFGKNKWDWNPPGVVSHEIGHLIGPTRNAESGEIRNFQRAFGYKQKKVYHEQAPQRWRQRRDNPVKGQRIPQAKDAAEDFAETWRSITGEPLRMRTAMPPTVTNAKRFEHMQRYVLK